jgi:hypothetical protein
LFVSWQPPLSTGVIFNDIAGVISGYKVTAHPGGAFALSATTATVVPNLQYGVEYTFTVTVCDTPFFCVFCVFRFVQQGSDTN